MKILGHSHNYCQKKNEEGDRVVVEGEVQCKKKDGGMLDAFFIDSYWLHDGKIKEMRLYLVEKK